MTCEGWLGMRTGKDGVWGGGGACEAKVGSA